MNKLFVLNTSPSEYRQELDFALKNPSKANQEELRIVNLQDLSIDLLQKYDIQVVVSDSLPLEWVYVLKGLQIVSVVLGDGDMYYRKADILIDFKKEDSRTFFSGPSYSTRSANFNLHQVSDLISMMPWDSQFFGFPIAYVSSIFLSDNIQYRIDQFVKKHQVQLIQYLCNCHDDLSVKIAEKNAYHFTDIRLTFSKKIENVLSHRNHRAYDFGIAKEQHIEMLKSLTKDMYKDSRYFFDGNFEVSQINTFYSEWVEKAVLGTFDHQCFCIFDQDLPVAFCTLRYSDNFSEANIGLFGVGSSYSGKGLGKSLLEYVFGEAEKEGCKNISVVTQGRNYAAQKLYQSAGFRTEKTELWYHRW